MRSRWAWLALLPYCGHCAVTAPRARSFHLEYRAEVSHLPSGARNLELWIPVPHDDAYQQIRNLQIDSPYPFRIVAGALGNQMLHLRVERPGKPEFSVTVRFDATREEHRQPRLYHRAGAFTEESPEERAAYLKPDRLVPLDDQIRAWARQVVEAAHAHTDLEMARAIYNHVVATVKYDKSGQGWGRGDIYYACEARRGNCTDFHAIFIGYCRAVGIPARFAIGLPLPKERGEGRVAGYHCWAEFYAQGIGWVPIDASEAAKDPGKRDYFFGTHDENRLEFSKGRDVILAPRQRGEPLNYFISPYAELDGKPFAGASSAVTYHDTRQAAGLRAEHRLQR